jgi:hypothetical protein
MKLLCKKESAEQYDQSEPCLADAEVFSGDQIGDQYRNRTEYPGKESSPKWIYTEDGITQGHHEIVKRRFVATEFPIEKGNDIVSRTPHLTGGLGVLRLV